MTFITVSATLIAMTSLRQTGFGMSSAGVDRCGSKRDFLSIGHRTSVRQRLALLMVSLSLTAAMIEAVMRLWPALFDFFPAPEYYMPHVFAEDPTITWTLKPNATSPHQHLKNDFAVRVNTDGRGMRRIPQTPGRPNLLVLGDSFAFGFGVEDNETFPSRLAELMPGINVLNAGYTSGMSLDTQYLYLREHFDEFWPSLVICQFCGGNDFGDIESNTWQTDTNGLPQKIVTAYLVDRRTGALRITRTGALSNIAVFLRRHSFLCAFLLDRVAVVRGRFHGSAEAPPPEYRVALARLRVLAAALKQCSREKGFDLAFVFIPATYDARVGRVVEPSEQTFKEYLRKLDIKYTDLETLRPYDRRTLHFPHDAHYTPFGNRLVAVELNAFIRTNFPNVARAQ
ncbi:MAG: hypothetical protein ACOYOU_02550 [Kiritimatiellia bacterium]